MNEEKFDFNEYYNKRYTSEVNWYDEKSISAKKWYYSLQISIIVIASLTPIFAFSGSKWLTTFASIIVAVSTGIIKFMKVEENWINYRGVCELLKKESSYFKAGINEYSQLDEKEKIFVSRVENLISRENSTWVNINTPHEKKKQGNATT
jgi:hypothetical protein